MRPVYQAAKLVIRKKTTDDETEAIAMLPAFNLFLIRIPKPTAINMPAYTANIVVWNPIIKSLINIAKTGNKNASAFLLIKTPPKMAIAATGVKFGQ